MVSSTDRFVAHQINGTESVVSRQTTSTTSHTFKIVKEGTTIKYYMDDTLLTSETMTVNCLYLTYHIWNTGTIGFTNLKIKPL